MSISSDFLQFPLTRIESEMKTKPDIPDALRKATQLVPHIQLEEISSEDDSDPFEDIKEASSVLKIGRKSKENQGKVTYVTEAFTSEFREVILETRKTEKVSGGNIIQVRSTYSLFNHRFSRMFAKKLHKTSQNWSFLKENRKMKSTR